jgi:NitT/TauT family transport system ATP-binding protein
MNYPIHKLSKCFGDKVIFNNAEFLFKGGETNAIVGASGIGKTTLLRILLSLETPDSGDISSLHGLRFSAVFQEYRLCENLSASANVRLVTTREQGDELLKELGLKESISLPVREFSGGMKQRVSIARALAAPFDILVLDEPFTGLDDDTKERTIACIKRHTKGKTIILVTHDAKEREMMQVKNTISLA